MHGQGPCTCSYMCVACACVSAAGIVGRLTPGAASPGKSAPVGWGGTGAGRGEGVARPSLMTNAPDRAVPRTTHALRGRVARRRSKPPPARASRPCSALALMPRQAVACRTPPRLPSRNGGCGASPSAARAFLQAMVRARAAAPPVPPARHAASRCQAPPVPPARHAASRCQPGIVFPDRDDALLLVIPHGRLELHTVLNSSSSHVHGRALSCCLWPLSHQESGSCVACQAAGHPHHSLCAAPSRVGGDVTGHGGRRRRRSARSRFEICRRRRTAFSTECECALLALRAIFSPSLAAFLTDPAACLRPCSAPRRPRRSRSQPATERSAGGSAQAQDLPSRRRPRRAGRTRRSRCRQTGRGHRTSQGYARACRSCCTACAPQLPCLRAPVGAG